MSRLVEFRAAEKALQAQIAQLESMKQDSSLKREIEFEEKLLDLMKAYKKGLNDIVDILDPHQREQASTRSGSAPKKATRRARQVKVYENPHSGELIETKGGNHRGLKAWKQEYGADTVESWVRS
ncbi:DNA binding protein [Pseudomonas entomophila]|uniref:histone-like nucleoid-structuring protein, MvaT/MvaU family n=1 Tax=Pseudomonas entomophila TaxID=312306 RepID=UPI0015E2A237|nr:histone-like nucleoid-structuring protein, MvaT/MvaU family [Pseudomonas entomophila]MBA1192936.1 DNA binding protein [Pseudomonas entomophila]